MPSISAIQWKRRGTQLIFLWLIGEFSYYGMFRCPFAVPYVSCANCPVVQCPGRKLWLSFWLLLLASTILFGRAFCGYACPGGMVSQVLGKAAIVRGRMKGLIDRLLGTGKYVAALACLYVLFPLHNPRWAIPIRTGEFFQSTALTFEHANSFWLVRTWFVVGALALGIMIPHFWCRYLCPTGGILDILKRFSVLRYFKTEACTDCNECRSICEIETRPEEANCTNCAACPDICPVNAIEFGWKKRKIPKKEKEVKVAASGRSGYA